MASGYDDDRDDREEPMDEREGREDRHENRQERIARARAKVATPGLFLLLAGLLCLALEVAAIGVMLTKPTLIYDFVVDMIERGPPGPEKQKQLDDMKKEEASMRLDSPMNIGSIAVGFILGVLTTIGAVKMRSGSGYGLALTGAIASIIPIGGCCCVGMPVGIWALVVLMNPDVKKGFAAAAEARHSPDGY